jgi:hypothetical protein
MDWAEATKKNQGKGYTLTDGQKTGMLEADFQPTIAELAL